MVRAAAPLSLLECALVALIRQAPASGYDLRKLFADTPFVHFSDSPGAVYPALRRLEQRGLVAEARGEARDGRGRRGLRLTPRGQQALVEWLRRPVVRDDLLHGRDAAMLRFAFTEEVLGGDACARFLEQYAVVLAAYVLELEAYGRQHLSEATLSGRLAFECGLEGFRARLRWCRRAGRRLQKEA